MGVLDRFLRVGEGKKVKALQSLVPDISALEHARARLAQLSAIVESSDDAILGKTLDGIITTWNAGATRLYGYTADETSGRHASFLYPPGRKEEIDDVLQQVRAGRPVEPDV